MKGRGRVPALVLVALALVAAVAIAATVARGHSGASVSRSTEPARLPPVGLFIHYGPSTLLDEPTTKAWWHALQRPGYAALVRREFHPSTSVVSSWVGLAKAMHAGYIVFTAKHHDGYRLWYSPSRDSVNAHWGVDRAHDLVAALAAACRKARLPLYVYFSLVDVYSKDYRAGDGPAFWDETKRQLRQLLTRYGPVAGVWFDGQWDQKVANAIDPDALAAYVHSLQPTALVGNNRQPVGAGEDFSIYEQKLPDAPESVPQQTTYPLGTQWFYSRYDRPRPPAQLRSLLGRARPAGVSFLLDVPPQADGRFKPSWAREAVRAAAFARAKSR